MANLTLAIDDELLRRARIRALEQGTSVNALVREYLESFAAEDHRAAVTRFLELAAQSNAGSASGERTWAREDLYEERLSR